MLLKLNITLNKSNYKYFKLKIRLNINFWVYKILWIYIIIIHFKIYIKNYKIDKYNKDNKWVDIYMRGLVIMHIL